MTREEAVNVLKKTALFLGRTNGNKALAEAVNMAITALEADNVVERIAYMSQLNGGANYFDAFRALQTALQTDGDCISRQAAIGEVAEWMLEYGGEDEKRERVALGHVANGIKKLPSTQPDNSCDGCRYENADDGVLVPCGFCKRSHSDNYERRTDD